MTRGMVSHKTQEQRGLAPKESARSRKRKRDGENIDELKSRVEQLETVDNGSLLFSDLPFSKATAAGLEASHFKTMTDIQRKAVPLALKQQDILGAAKTGSGKTLAFLVPVLENLYRQQWTEFDGLGALILSPTRELAIQIFEVLRKIGRYHTFSAGLVIGGKSLEDERERLFKMNILVCTPGRILQHLDQTAALEVDNLQMLVLDEADRIMDMGFQSTVDAIVEHLPKSRQTLLFSATQTKRVSDLARLSLRDPAYVSVHEKADTATPASLQQHYIVTPLHEKLDVLWSFIRANTKSKILVFLSSGKQVRFVFESFRHLQPGMPLLHLHGRQKQTARLDITKRFSSMKQACLLATDVVARGLDFPAVDWVLQVDCPEDADTYIHRVGRTARYERDGRAVLMLEPTEEKGMLTRLEQKRIPIEMIKVRQKKQESIRNQLQNMCFRNPEIKYLGQKAFISYVRSVHVQHDKDVFQVQKLPLEEFAASLGLPGAPRIKFQSGLDVKAIKNRPRGMDLSSDDEVETPTAKEPIRTRYDRMFERQNQDVLAPHRQKIINGSIGQDQEGQSLAEEDDEDDFLTVRRRLTDPQLDSGAEPSTSNMNPHEGEEILEVRAKDLPVVSKRRGKMLQSKETGLKYQGKGSKVIYDDDGNPRKVYEMGDEEAFQNRTSATDERLKWVEREAAKFKAQDVADKQALKEIKREQKENRKAREREEAEDGMQATKAGFNLPLVPFEDFGGSDDVSNAGDGTQTAQEDGTSTARKKWFQDSSDEDRDPKKRKNASLVEDAETLEDLEALAQSYI